MQIGDLVRCIRPQDSYCGKVGTLIYTQKVKVGRETIINIVHVRFTHNDTQRFFLSSLAPAFMDNYIEALPLPE